MKYNPKVNERLARLPGFRGRCIRCSRRTTPRARSSSCSSSQEILARDRRASTPSTLQPAAGAQGELAGPHDRSAPYHAETRRGATARGADPRLRRTAPTPRRARWPASTLVDGEDRTRAATSTSSDLRASSADETAALMITNPNTLGLFERQIAEIADDRARRGRRSCYCDGANLNALLGIARPGDMGFDVDALQPAQDVHRRRTAAAGPGGGPIARRRGARAVPARARSSCRDGERLPPRLRPARSRSAGVRGLPRQLRRCFVRAYCYIRVLGAGRAARGDARRRC